MWRRHAASMPDGCRRLRRRHHLGADNICHTPTCAPSVKSGRDGCGAFALKFCQPGEPSYKYLAGIDRIEVTNE